MPPVPPASTPPRRARALRVGCAFSAVLATWGTLVGPARAQEVGASSGGDPVRVHVPRVEEPPPVDASLEHPAWERAARLGGWVQTSPGDNTEPVGETEALFLHDDEALWIAIRAEDAPGSVRWATHRRDVVHRQAQDYIGLHIDTFNDRRQTFYFVTNPVGIQGDGIYRETSTGEINTGYVPWDGIFDTEGEVAEDGSGYRVVFRIPFSTLRFRDEETQVWGFSLLRRYGRSEAEDSPWPLDRDLACDFCQMAEMVLEGVEPGANLEVNPALVTTASAERPAVPGPMEDLEGDVEPSLNVKYGITPNLTLDATLNPDFSQVEADAGQLEVNNRFALFFRETRPFFQEGAGVFATGVQLPDGERAPLNLFHSRTIISPDWGTKLSGKVGRVGVGFLAAEDAAAPPDLSGLPGGLGEGGAFSAVGRVTVDVGADGYVGGIFTHRGHEGDGDRVAALDGRLRVGNLVLSGMGALSRFASPWPAFGAPGDALPGGGSDDDGVTGEAVQLQATWLSRSWTGGVAVVDITPDFRTPLGFVPRTDQLRATGTWGWIWRGTGLVRRFQPSLTFERIWFHDETRLLSGGALADERWEPKVTVDLARANQVELGYSRTFTAYGGEDFPAQDRIGVSLRSDAFARVQLQASVDAGEGVIFSDRTAAGTARPGWAVEGNLAAVLRPHSSVRIDVGARGSRIWRRDDGEARESLYATALIPRLRTEVQLSSRLGFRGILEHQGERFYGPGGGLAHRDEELLADVLFSYVVNHGSAVYVGWTELQHGDLERSLTTDRRGGVAKVTYVWRF